MITVFLIRFYFVSVNKCQFTFPYVESLGLGWAFNVARQREWFISASHGLTGILGSITPYLRTDDQPETYSHIWMISILPHRWENNEQKCLGRFSPSRTRKESQVFKNYLCFALEFIYISICHEPWLPSFLANRDFSMQYIHINSQIGLILALMSQFPH